MAVDNFLLKEFSEIINSEKKEESNIEYGTAIYIGDELYVIVDGSSMRTPASTIVSVKTGDRVNFRIINNKLYVVGNISDPAASGEKVVEIDNTVTDLSGTVQSISANYVSTKVLDAQVARIDNITSDLINANQVITNDLTAANASIENLKTEKLSASEADIKYATIANLNAANATINSLEANKANIADLNATNAKISNLETNSLTAESADLKYAQIDFSNITMASVEELFSKSGIINNLTVGDASISGELVGVTIKGDIIEGGTIVADKLVVKGSDGIYYALNTNGESVEASQTDYNSLNGSIITAKSITATKINVHDLVAFGATIGGYHITENSLYSGTKASATNTTRGVFMNTDGEFVTGDKDNYLMFFKDTDDTYKLALRASNVTLSSTGASVEDSLQDISTTANEARQAAAQVGTSLEQTTKDITQTVSGIDGRVTQLTQTAENMTLKFQKMVSQQEDTNNSVQEQYKEIRKYINFSDGNIILGEEGNHLELVITKDRISFMDGEDELAYWSNKTLYVTKGEFTESARIGNFAFVPRINGNLSFKKIGD